MISTVRGGVNQTFVKMRFCHGVFNGHKLSHSTMDIKNNLQRYNGTSARPPMSNHSNPRKTYNRKQRKRGKINR